MVFTRDPIAETVDKPPGKRGWGFKVVVGFFVLVILATTFGLARKWLTDEPSVIQVTSPDAGIAETLGEPAPVVPAGAACAIFPAVEAEADMVAPPAPVWSRDGGTAVPSHPDVGPAFTSPVSWCYAHSPTGALFAAANYVAQMQAIGMTPVDEISLARYGAADSAARASLISRFAAVGTGEVRAPVLEGSRVAPPQFVAYHVVAYTPLAAQLQIVSAWNDSLSAVNYNLVWQAGDWKLDLPLDGAFPSVAVELPLDTTHWIPWKAVAAG